MTAPEVRRLAGSAASLHARTVDAPAGPEVWWLEVERPALVLGSTQRDDVVDRAAAQRRGVEVARRRSGGGAVLLEPGGCTWVDVILPATDPRWDHDVVRSSGWLGDAWREALRSVGIDGGTVHRGPATRYPLAALVCFGGLGPGEVTVEGRKVVGISQRRTRDHARFQCSVLHRWEPGAIVELLALGDDERPALGRALAPAAVGTDDLLVGRPGPALPGELVAALAAIVHAG